MRGYFYGWYFKCQSKTQTIAIIPAVHGSKKMRTCSIQFITETDTWTVTFPGSCYHHIGDTIFIGRNRFGKNGIHLDIQTPMLQAQGRLRFGGMMPLRYDIMGPFAAVPYMECRHSVYSMCHPIWGKLKLNGKSYSFENALGYWEGDRGASFPKAYAWTQCFFKNGSLMLSVADIPLAGIRFTGMIGVVLWKGKEYRFATYLGGKVIQKRNKKLWITQRGMELEAQLLDTFHQSLNAPTDGDMTRTIYENAACHAVYRFRIKGQTVFAFHTHKASFEYEYE